MTQFATFATNLKIRHDFSDQLMARYAHPTGEDFDTWISGEEAEARLKTADRKKLIQQFSTLNREDAKRIVRSELEESKQQAKKGLFGRLGDLVEDNLGGNPIGDTLADRVRGRDSTIDPRDREKQKWVKRLQDPAFRMMIIQLAWLDLRDVLPDESQASDFDDWV